MTLYHQELGSSISTKKKFDKELNSTHGLLIVVFWAVTPCGLGGGTNISEESVVSIYRYKLQFDRRENLKYHKCLSFQMRRICRHDWMYLYKRCAIMLNQRPHDFIKKRLRSRDFLTMKNRYF